MTERRRSNNYSQRELVPLLAELIDAASAKGAGAHRDIARAKLRTVLREENWATTFVFWNLGPTRNKYLAGLGKPVPWRFLSRAASFDKYAPPKKVEHDD